MQGRTLREALKSGRRVYGVTLDGYGQPRWPRMLAALGLDYVFLDSEHAPHNRETMAWAAQLYAAYDVAPLLRIPEISPSLAAQALDLGAQGVIVPYVETVEQVKAMVGAVKYRPLKGAALQKALDGEGFPSEATAAYLPGFNPDAVLVIMIESPAGVAQLPEMLKVAGVDAVLIGPHDFSISHGIPEQYDHPHFVAEAQRVARICRQRGVGAGIHYLDGPADQAVTWYRWGFNMINHRADLLHMTQSIRSEVQALRQVLDSPQDFAEGRQPG